MPIKLPKGFTRRKSSGNALDEVDNPPAPSFRVIERPDARRSVDGATALKQFNPRPLSPEDPHPDNLFAGIKKPTPKNRGSGGTNNSASTGGLFDSSSSGRYSSSSTLPSSTDVPIHPDTSASHTRTYADVPIPPIPETQPAFSLKAAGRTFSFGTRSTKPPMTPKEPSPPPPLSSRDRSMTTSTQSTATPPKLESDFNLGESDGFGSMFESFGKRKSALFNSGSPSPNIPTQDRGTPPIDPPQVPPQTFQRHKPLPTPTGLDAPRDGTPSRYSWGSQNSQDGLMESNSREEENMFANPTQRSNVPKAALSSGGLRRSVAYTGRRSSMPLEDDDAKAMTDSAPVNRQPARAPPVPQHRAQASVDSSAPLFDTPTDFSRNSQDWGNSSTPRARQQAPIRTVDEDMSFAAHARLAAQYEESEKHSGQPANKVMTPAQFEKYREQKELSRSQSDASKSQLSDEDSDDYDEEDELEQKREAAKQRQKQEAHLSVYRQQMMKTTGNNQTMDSASSIGGEKASASTPNLLNRMSTLGLGPDQQIGGGKSADTEEDDDVPLGILAAHGFPHRNRPPGTLSSSNSNPNLRASVSPYPPPPASHAGDPRPGPNRSSTLPVFAKNLPQDPYGLVHSGNRESLAMGGGSVQGRDAPGSMHPGGLIGVIANEERAKAMRRGSPNSRAQEFPGGMPQMNMGPMGPSGPMQGMGGMPPHMQNPQMLSPGDQAQIQMSQQMNQMMQMQMQWMQQMMQAQGMQGPQNPEQMAQMNQMNPMNQMNQMNQNQMNNGFLAPPGPNMRPTSMVSNNGVPRTVDQRTLSMLDPSMSSQQYNNNSRLSFIPPVQGAGSMNGGPGPQQLRQNYAPSMAPSERSNVGMSPRYRPVSTVNPGANPPNNQGARSSTFTASTLRPWAKKERQSSISSQSPAPPSHQPQKSTTNATLTVRPVSSTSMSGLNHTPAKLSPEDEDEDDGWAEMMKKREKKKSTWKMKKENSGLGDLYPSAVI